MQKAGAGGKELEKTRRGRGGGKREPNDSGLGLTALTCTNGRRGRLGNRRWVAKGSQFVVRRDNNPWNFSEKGGMARNVTF